MKKTNRYQEKKEGTKKGVQSTNFEEKLRAYQYKMLLLIKNGHYAGSISRQMKVPKTTTECRMKRLLELGLIKVDAKTTATFYVLTKKGYESLKGFNARLSRYPRGIGKTRLHRLNIKFDILKDEGKMQFDKEYELNNWIQKFVKLRFPVGITIKKTSKSIIAMFHEFETSKSKCLNDFFNHIMRGSYFVYYYCRKNGMDIDLFSAEVLDQHIVNEMPELAGKIDGNKTTTLNLNRKAKSFFKTDFMAKAWIDHSKGIPEVETNDFLYEERFLSMPENIYQMNMKLAPTLEKLSLQIELHLKATGEWRDSAREIRDALKDIVKLSTGNKGVQDERK